MSGLILYAFSALALFGCIAGQNVVFPGLGSGFVLPGFNASASGSVNASGSLGVSGSVDQLKGLFAKWRALTAGKSAAASANLTASLNDMLATAGNAFGTVLNLPAAIIANAPELNASATATQTLLANMAGAVTIALDNAAGLATLASTVPRFAGNMSSNFPVALSSLLSTLLQKSNNQTGLTSAVNTFMQSTGDLLNLMQAAQAAAGLQIAVSTNSSVTGSISGEAVSGNVLAAINALKAIKLSIGNYYAAIQAKVDSQTNAALNLFKTATLNAIDQATVQVSICFSTNIARAAFLAIFSVEEAKINLALYILKSLAFV